MVSYLDSPEYEVENPKVADATATARLQTHLAPKPITYIFDDSEKKEENPVGEEGVETPRHPGDDDKERQPEETAKLCMEQAASGEPQFQGDEFAPKSFDTDHHWDPAGRPPW